PIYGKSQGFLRTPETLRRIGRGMEHKRPQDRARAGTEVPLPPERAFVVQLRPQADPAEELFVGRVEHIASGEFVRFGSAAELLAFMANVGRATPRQRPGTLARFHRSREVAPAPPSRELARLPVRRPWSSAPSRSAFVRGNGVCCLERRMDHRRRTQGVSLYGPSGDPQQALARPSTLERAVQGTP